MTLLAGIDYKCEYCGNPTPNVSRVHERRGNTRLTSGIFGTGIEINAEQSLVCSGPVKIYCTLCGREYQEIAHVLRLVPEQREEFIGGFLKE